MIIDRVRKGLSWWFRAGVVSAASLLERVVPREDSLERVAETADGMAGRDGDDVRLSLSRNVDCSGRRMVGCWRKGMLAVLSLPDREGLDLLYRTAEGEERFELNESRGWNYGYSGRARRGGGREGLMIDFWGCSRGAEQQLREGRGACLRRESMDDGRWTMDGSDPGQASHPAEEWRAGEQPQVEHSECRAGGTATHTHTHPTAVPHLGQGRDFRTPPFDGRLCGTWV